MKEKPEKPGKSDESKAPESAGTEETETFGEALDKMGFVPLDPPRRIIIRPDGSCHRLRRWWKPKDGD